MATPETGAADLKARWFKPLNEKEIAFFEDNLFKIIRSTVYQIFTRFSGARYRESSCCTLKAS